jgi:hypothetical protein
MKRTYRIRIMPLTGLLAILSLLVTSCSKNNEQPVSADGQSITVTDLPGDTSATMAGGAASFTSLYFSFVNNSKVDIIDADKPSLKWDLAFTGPYNSEIYVNSGEYLYNPGYGGPGKGAVIQVDSAFDLVTTAPADALFDASTLTKIGWDAGNGAGWFFYSLDNHIAVPIRNRTFILRTAAGKYAKLELLNVYKGNPPVVTDLFWPAPYFTFRYFVQADSGHNLKTK